MKYRNIFICFLFNTLVSLVKMAIYVIWILDIVNVNVNGIPWLNWLAPMLNDSNGLNGLFWFLVLVFENLTIPFDRARPAFLGTSIEHLEHISGRIS